MEDVIFAFIPILALMIPIIALLYKPLQRWMDIKEKQMGIAATTAGEQAAQYAAKIERLEAHVAVLNRIVTDKSTGLADEIEQLRTAAPAPTAKLN
jgi:hypothetical protein